MDESQVRQADTLVSKVGGQHRDLNVIPRPHVGNKTRMLCLCNAGEANSGSPGTCGPPSLGEFQPIRCFVLCGERGNT